MADERTTGRAPVLDILVALLLVVAIGATFAPWLRSGASQRTSYEVVRAADRLEVLDASPQRVVNLVWSLVPAGAAIALFALVRERRLVTGIASIAVGALISAFALVVYQAPDAADWGVTLGLVSSIGLVIGGALMVVHVQRSTR